MKFEIRKLTPSESREMSVLYELKITENNGFSWYVYECKNMRQVIELIAMAFDNGTITSAGVALTINKTEA